MENDNQHQKTKTILSSWLFKPALEYYLSKPDSDFNVFVDNDFKTSSDYIYCFQKEKEMIADSAAYVTMIDYSDTKTVLLRRK
ncbi:MAG: hypothetical protein KG029_15085 [Bacteroidetes bacterium]|nr:hypothetical protein [Bacteroidota bacterium]